VANRLNPRQAGWALFFNCFDFLLTYRPGSKNTKADTLSRQHDYSDQGPVPENIIPPCRVVRQVRVALEESILQAQQTELDPDGGPPGHLLIPAAVRSEALR